MVDALKDRVDDYYEYCLEFEAPNVNENGRHCYPYGFGQALKDALEFIKQLKQLKDNIQ